MKKIVYVNHGLAKACGVYDLGVRHFNSIKNIDEYNVIYYEINNIDDYFQMCLKEKPDGIFFNYMRFTSPWINENINLYKCKKYCVPHLFYKDSFFFEEDPNKSIFDYFIILDKNSQTDSRVFKTDRPLVEFNHYNTLRNDIPKIGSFGFGVKRKMLDLVVKHVNECFDEAEINFHIPQPHFINASEEPEVIRDCYKQITKPGIKINFTTEFLPDIEVIKILSVNDINCLFYPENMTQGISSSLDYLISAQKPVMVTNSEMFRSYIHDVSIYPTTNLKEIYDNFYINRTKIQNTYDQSINKIKTETKNILDLTCTT